MLHKIKGYYNNAFHGLSPISLLKQWYKDPKEWCIDNRNKLQHLAQTNLHLAIYHFNNGDSGDAIFRLHLLKLFSPFPPAAQYYMGRCYMEKFKPNKAKHYLLEYKRTGDQKFATETEYCLQVLDKRPDIDAIPISIVTHNCDRAAKYQRNPVLTEKKGQISLQRQICDMLATSLTNNEQSLAKNVLDLGCGSGILGQYIRQARMANVIVGVDISSKMLEIAQTLQFDGMQTYSRLIHQDVREFFIKSNDRNIYDIVIASNLVTYFRDIKLLFDGIDKLSTETAILVLSFKNTKDQGDQRFIHNIEEFHYSKQYIQRVIADTVWEINMDQSASIKSREDMTILLLSKKAALNDSIT